MTKIGPDLRSDPAHEGDTRAVLGRLFPSRGDGTDRPDREGIR